MTKFYLYASRYLTVLLFLITTLAWSQSTVTGKVTAADDGSGLPGVNIIEKGTSNGTVTDANGNFTITVPGNAVLVFSFVGYQSQEIAVDNRTTINVPLSSDVTALSEVVVIGYGQIDKKDATGALVSLKPGDFNGGVIASPEQLIQGRAAGVQITSASGEPGAGINMRIRGTSSVRSGNNPLFVVDGVPLSGDDVSPGASNGALGDSPPKNPLNFINPNDIASIDILKDASATAIYGSRGANGVVIITTKSGKSGAGNIEYSYNLGFGHITKKLDLLNRDEFISAYTQFNGATAAAALDKGASTDWQNQVLRTAVTNNHNLSFGGADATGSFRISLGYQNQEGIIKNSGMKRYTALLKGTKKFLNDRLTLSTQVTVADVHDDNVPITNNSGFEGDLFGSALKSNPTAPVYNPDGTPYQPSNVEPNPVAYLKLSRSFTNTLRSLGNVSAELKIIEGLTFKTVFGFDRSFSSRKTAFSRDLRANNGIFGIGRAYLNDIEVSNNLWENYFTYNKELSSSVKFTGLLGYSYQSFSNSRRDIQLANFRTSNLDLMINNLAAIDPTKISMTGNSSAVKDELQSYYGRFDFTISDKYIVTGTLRADGSTKFGGNNKYGYFPSAAFKWRASEEAFIPEAFSDLNVRLGYGITGNQEIPHNLYQERQRYNTSNFNTGGTLDQADIGSVSFKNSDLKWESTSQINIGIDYGFFDNRLRGSIDYYHKNTSDLLIQVISAQPAPQPFTYTNLNANVINKGVELALEGDVVNNSSFKWTIVGNVAFNRNRVENFKGLLNTGQINGQGLTGAFAQRIANNQPLYAWFLRDFAGFDENGISIYNGGDVQKFLNGKSPLPTTNAGLTNNFRYENFDLSIFFSGQFGQYIYNNTANAYFTAGSLANGRNVTKNVVGNGESNLNAPDVSTRFLENGSFVRLQNVTLGYNIPTTNTFIKSLRVSVTGQNLLTFTGYKGQDPEVNVNKALNNVPSLGIDYAGYPRARTLTFGVNATF
ncbi:SusC/RagA family TonB-linked outer membrane protein [Ohtaekwangia sp.]|uniref:SusC/RagA family TonB-linked outer membrane protein n=1 Tax=Ohtaekwangia sp. TaxID=2066019 RepID=UPI002F91EA76